MPYTVPQFIEREPKIVGPFTFKQFSFIGAAGALSILLYFILPRFLFVIAAIFLMGTALAMVFLKISGFPLPVLIKNFFIFLTSKKIYLWKKKDLPPKILKKEAVKEVKEEKGPTLKISEGGRLKNLTTFLETRNK
jgi:hypothetical protein